jgi:hypothetical protein
VISSFVTSLQSLFASSNLASTSSFKYFLISGSQAIFSTTSCVTNLGGNKVLSTNFVLSLGLKLNLNNSVSKACPSKA